MADDVETAMGRIAVLSHERCRQILRTLVRRTSTDDGNGLWLLDFGAFAVGVLEEAGLVTRPAVLASTEVVEPAELGNIVELRPTATPRGFIRLVPSADKEGEP